MAGRRLDQRRMAEAAEARGVDETTVAPKKRATKKAATPRARKVKEKVQARKRLVWVVFNGSMKEEARFPYDQFAEAEERIEALRQKSKKLYFIQPVKELIGDGAPVASAALVITDDPEQAAALEELELEDEEEVEVEEEAEEEEEEEEEEDDDE